MSATDGILVVSHIYLIADLLLDWDAFDGCSKPVHKWSLVSYLVMLSSRFVCGLGNQIAARGGVSMGFLINARHKDEASKFLFRLTWCVIVPFIAAWNFLGTYWIFHVIQNSSHMLAHIECHLWMMAFWLLISYAWTAIHLRIGTVAWLLEVRVRSTVQDLREVTDADTISRWGDAASQIQDYSALRGAQANAGLSPAQILALPCEEVVSENAGSECAICLLAVETGDKARSLKACGHVFHKSCIDLWLLRSSLCPLCKTCTKSPAPLKSSEQEEEQTSLAQPGLRRRPDIRI